MSDETKLGALAIVLSAVVVELIVTFGFRACNREQANDRALIERGIVSATGCPCYATDEGVQP